MGTYRRKPVDITAAPFSWGMEKGVMRYNQYIPKDAESYPEGMRSTQYPGYLARYDDLLEDRGYEPGQWNPYVEIMPRWQRVIVKEGHYLIPAVPYPDGTYTRVASWYELQKDYTPLDMAEMREWEEKAKRGAAAIAAAEDQVQFNGDALREVVGG